MKDYSKKGGPRGPVMPELPTEPVAGKDCLFKNTTKIPYAPGGAVMVDLDDGSVALVRPYLGLLPGESALCAVQEVWKTKKDYLEWKERRRVERVNRESASSNKQG